MSYSLGEVVCSTAGRDARRYFLIVQAVDENFVMIADGGYHKLAHPKKKKLKHLHATGKCAESIAAKLACGAKVFDSEVRSAIDSLTGSSKIDEECIHV